MKRDDIQTHPLSTIRVTGLKCTVLVGIPSQEICQALEVWVFYLISRGNFYNAFSLCVGEIHSAHTPTIRQLYRIRNQGTK